jgi:hypothetical protein
VRVGHDWTAVLSVPVHYLLELWVKRSQIRYPQTNATILASTVEDDQRFTFARPENARIVEARDVRESGPVALAL